MSAKGLVFILALALSTAMLGPYVFPLDTFPATEGRIDQDCFQGVWNLWFATESLTSGRSPFETNAIYFPLGAHLAHHTLTPGYAPFVWVVARLCGGNPLSPLYAYRLLPLLCFALSIVFTVRLLQALGFGPWVRWTLAISYTFSRLQVHHLIHPNYLAGWFLPLCGWQLVELYRVPSRARAFLLAALLAVGVYFTELTLYVYVAIAMLVALLCVRRVERRRVLAGLRTLGPKTLAGCMALFFAVLAPYVVALRRDDIVRPELRESVQYSSNLLGFVVPARGATPLYGDLFAPLARHITAGIDGSEVFLGFVPILLSCVALLCVRDRLVRGAALLAAVFLIASLGPTLQVSGSETGLPMPYAWLGRLPVFEWGRTPVRFVAIAGLFGVVVAACGMAWIERRLVVAGRRRVAIGASVALLVWAVAESIVPATEKVRFTPPAALAGLPPGPVLNLPPREKDGYAALLQTMHHQPIATGYTARISLQRLRHIRALRRSFDRGGPEFWALLQKLGFRTVVVTPREITDANASSSMAPLGPAPAGIRMVDLREPPAGRDDCDANHGPAPPLPPRIDFTRDTSQPFLCYGWGDVEAGGRWTIRGQAALRVSVSSPAPARLRCLATPFLVSGRIAAQHVEVSVDGRPLARWELTDPQPREYSCEIPAGVLRGECTLALRLPDAEGPVYMGRGADRRTLGIRVAWLQIESENPR